jgi:hypothetical protein
VSKRRDLKIRREACSLAATCFQPLAVGESYLPTLWSLVVFFERYMHEGASGTLKDFGPKFPKKLKVVK